MKCGGLIFEFHWDEKPGDFHDLIRWMFTPPQKNLLASEDQHQPRYGHVKHHGVALRFNRNGCDPRNALSFSQNWSLSKEASPCTMLFF
jgi:hypothetical protein